MNRVLLSQKKSIHANDLGLMPLDHRKYISDYAFFHQTFVGLSFKDVRTGKIKSKLTIFWGNPKAAMQMAKTLTIPKDQYTLVDSEGWRDGYRIY